MPYKAFLSATGSGNTVFEGDVINGHTSPDGSRVVLRFYTNDRGYSCGSYYVDVAGARALRDELAALLDSIGEGTAKFARRNSSQEHFGLEREFDGAPLILAAYGTPRQKLPDWFHKMKEPALGTSYHRGGPDTLKKVLAEFDTVLKTVTEVSSGKAPAA